MPQRLSRRQLLRASGVAIALPMLEAMQTPTARAGFATEAQPRRMFCINTNMGMMPQFFWPQGEGFGYRASEYLSLIDDHRGDFTVFSGMSHPDVDGGHHAEISFLTGAPHPGSGGFKNSISLDQYAAERIGPATRYPFISLCVGGENNTLSWTAAGVRIPAEKKPSELFRQLFVQGDAQQVETQVRQLQVGRSVLDAVADHAQRLLGRVGRRDRDKLDQYFESVRELEQRLVVAEQWQYQPKPDVDAQPPRDIEDRTQLIERTRLMYRMARLALQTDSTRIIALTIDQNTNPRVALPGVDQPHHSLTHHGNRDESIAQLKIIEAAQTQVFGELLGDLKAQADGAGTLLDATMVLYGSNLGNANSHDNKNLPILLAGGGFPHGRHLTFDKRNNAPLANLFVTMLQRLGIETARFASSTGTLSQLDAV